MLSQKIKIYCIAKRQERSRPLVVPPPPCKALVGPGYGCEFYVPIFEFYVPIVSPAPGLLSQVIKTPRVPRRARGVRLRPYSVRHSRCTSHSQTDDSRHNNATSHTTSSEPARGRVPTCVCVCIQTPYCDVHSPTYLHGDPPSPPGEMLGRCVGDAWEI